MTEPSEDGGETEARRARRARDAGVLKIRVPKSMVDALEEYLETLRTQPPFIHMSRAEAIRWLIAVGLERERAEQARRDDLPASDDGAPRSRTAPDPSPGPGRD